MNMIAPPILDRLHALGDESRTRILALLERSELTVTELASVLQLAQPTVSRHLKTLAAEGWVEARADGRNRHYRMARDLDAPARELWRIVNGEIRAAGVYALDAERARGVLEERRLRSAEFFARAAERWDEVREELFGASIQLTPLLGLLSADATVADLGAGTGSLSDTVAPFVARVLAVDSSEQMLAAAAHRLDRHHNVELRRGELESLPMSDAEVDVAVIGLVLHYVVDPPAVFAEAHRVLRPGGRLLLLDVDLRGDTGPELYTRIRHLWGEDPPEVWFITGNNRNLDPARDEALGARGTLLKPLGLSKLRSIVEESQRRPPPER